MFLKMDWLNRTELLLGNEKLAKLKKSHVLIIGLGGVGAYAAEMLCRAGVGQLTLIDSDNVELTNLNRQLPATLSSIGKPKSQVLADRFHDINPELKINLVQEYLNGERMIEILQYNYDYVVDAIDTLTPKVNLIYQAVQRGLPIVSSMGAGGKLNPELVRASDISKSFNCKLARMLRKKLGRLGIRNGVKVVFSSEEVPETAIRLEESTNKKSVVGTISYLPPVFGCHISAVVIADLINKQ